MLYINYILIELEKSKKPKCFLLTEIGNIVQIHPVSTLIRGVIMVGDV